jgi:hypothetical protein
MMMATQVVSVEDDEAYSVQFFDDCGNTVSVYFQNPQNFQLSPADAVNEALAPAAYESREPAARAPWKESKDNMPLKTGLLRGDLRGGCMHLCIDMQNLFGPASPWHVPWVQVILPNIVDICSRHSENTVFTRFIPPRTPDAAVGAWRGYFRKWEALTLIVSIRR